MQSDDEISEDEEEILVYVEFEGLVDSNTFSEEQLQLDIVGVDTEHPIMQINGRFYEGSYEDAIGTYIFFTKDENPIVEDSVFDDICNLKYFAKTRKLLKMQRIFIKPRTEVLGDSEHNQCIPNLNTLKDAGIPVQYQTKALSFWKTMRNNRLSALHSYLEKQRVRQQKKSQGVTLESESDEDNPFAMYKHKQEESINTNKPEDIPIHLQHSELCSTVEYCKEIHHEIRDINKDNCQSNSKEVILKAKPSAPKDHNSYPVKSAKNQKAKTYRKKNIGIDLKMHSTVNKLNQTHSNNEIALTETKKVETDEESEEWDKSNGIENSTLSEMTE